MSPNQTRPQLLKVLLDTRNTMTRAGLHPRVKTHRGPSDLVERHAVAGAEVQEGAMACESETDDRDDPSRRELRWTSMGPTEPLSWPLLRHVDQHRSFLDGSRLPGKRSCRRGGSGTALPTLTKVNDGWSTEVTVSRSPLCWSSRVATALVRSLPAPPVATTI